jgi:hypothetical protein
VAKIIEVNGDAFVEFWRTTNYEPSPKAVAEFVNQLASQIDSKRASSVKKVLASLLLSPKKEVGGEYVFTFVEDNNTRKATENKSPRQRVKLNIKLSSSRSASTKKPIAQARRLTKEQAEIIFGVNNASVVRYTPLEDKNINKSVIYKALHPFQHQQKILDSARVVPPGVFEMARLGGGPELASSLILWYDRLLKEKNYSKDELGKTTILEEVAKQRIEVENSLVVQFQAAQEKLGLSPEGALVLFEKVRAKALIRMPASSTSRSAPESGAEPATHIPTTAPELYRDRQKRELGGVFRKENAEEFTRRVYQKWLGNGLLRSQLKNLDKGLIEALYKQGFPNDFNVLIPSTQGKRSDVESRSVGERLTARLDSQRRYDLKRGRRKTV